MDGPTRSPTGPHAKWLTASQTAAAGQAPSHHTPAVAAQRAGPLISDLARSRRGRSSPGTTPRARDSRMCFLAGCVRSWVRPVLRWGSRTSSIPQATFSAALSGCRRGARLRRWRLGPPTRAAGKGNPPRQRHARVGFQRLRCGDACVAGLLGSDGPRPPTTTTTRVLPLWRPSAACGEGAVTTSRRRPGLPIGTDCADPRPTAPHWVPRSGPRRSPTGARRQSAPRPHSSSVGCALRQARQRVCHNPPLRRRRRRHAPATHLLHRWCVDGASRWC